MKKGNTKTGFEYLIPDEVLDDWELLETFDEIDEGNEGLIVKAARMLLGAEQLSALKEHIRNETGKVSTSAMVREITEILHGDEEIKN